MSPCVRLLVLSVAVLLLSFSSVVRAERSAALPLELAEVLPMSADELLELADSSADFAVPTETLTHMEEAETQQPTQQAQAEEPQQALLEHESEANVEAEVEAEAAAATETETETGTESESESAVSEGEEGEEEEQNAPVEEITPAGDAGGAIGAKAAEGPPAVVVPLEPAIRRLKKHREEIVALEDAIAQQTAQMAVYTNAPVEPATGVSTSSGTNYYEEGMERLKSTHHTSATSAADDLTIPDARCVICQFVVQQTQGILAGKSLTSGGATSGGKRAAAAAEQQEEAAAFLELDAEAESAEEAGEFNFMELDASVDMMEGMSIEALLAAEAESTAALGAAMDTFMAASDSAMEHSATEAMRAHYGRRALPSRVYMGPNLRNVNPVSYPRQLNDHGFEEVTRNRHADILAFRPRSARFSKKDVEEQQRAWAATRETYQKLYSGVYDAVEKLCGHKMPLAYAAYCQDMLKDYRYIAQGIQYGDRAQSICMNGNWCDRQSYIRNAVHAYFVRENGDSP